MKTKIAMIQMDIAFGDPAANRRTAEAKIKEAADQGSALILLPELWTTGYDLTRLEEIAEDMEGPTHQLLQKLARDYSVTIAGSIAERDRESFYNTMVVYDEQGGRLLKYRKVHLFRLMDEEKYLESGDTQGTFHLHNVPLAGAICYDIRFPEWMRTEMLDGARV